VTTLKPHLPFVWPDRQVFTEPNIYEHHPPFGDLALGATWLFGVVPALTARGVSILVDWLDRNAALKISIIVVVYPACAVSQSDLADLQTLAHHHPDRFSARILALEQVTDRSINALCLSSIDSDAVHMVVGTSEDLGLDPWKDGHFNLAFQANPSLVEAFRCHFDWLWGRSGDVFLAGAINIPELVLPSGTVEAAAAWQAYRDELQSDEAHEGMSDGNVQAVLDLGEAIPAPSEEDEPQSPTERLGIKALDPLAKFVGELYGKGSLVSIDKLTRIPPLDAPVDPSIFGDASELRSGSAVRTVNMRVSVIDKKTLKEIDKCRLAQRTLLTKLSFGLADNMRWMPDAARKLFEAALSGANDEGLKLVKDLLEGDVDAFLAGQREKLEIDLNGIYSQLGRSGHVTFDAIEKVVASLRVRLTKAQSSNFMPKISYSPISLSFAENAFSSPWGQAFSLLSDIAVFPRKAHAEKFFFNGIKIPKKDLLEAMNVADDALLREPITWETEDRCKAEIGLLSKIEDAPIEPNDRCDLVWKIIQGTAITTVEAELEELKKKQREEEAD